MAFPRDLVFDAAREVLKSTGFNPVQASGARGGLSHMRSSSHARSAGEGDRPKGGGGGAALPALFASNTAMFKRPPPPCFAWSPSPASQGRMRETPAHSSHHPCAIAQGARGGPRPSAQIAGKRPSGD